MAKKTSQDRLSVRPAKPHLCFDRMPSDEAEMLAWAEIAVSVNPNNKPEPPAAAMALLASLCLTGVECAEPREFTPLEAASMTTKRWQNNQEITFGFSRAAEHIAAHFRNAVAEVSKYVNLRFREVGASSATLRIADYEEGSWAFVGTDALGIPRNKQTLNLARSWADLGTAIHELLHALSLIHEHQSPARPDDFWNEAAVYKAYGGPPNYWSRPVIKSNVIDRYSASQTQYTAFDKRSIMLYPLAAELLKDPSYATGWNRELSATDKAFLQKLYPKQDAPPPPPTGNKVRVVLEVTGDVQGVRIVEGS